MSTRNRILALVAALGILALAVLIGSRHADIQHSETPRGLASAGRGLDASKALERSSTQSKQPARISARQNYPELLTKAQQGNAEAANRLFRDMQQCSAAKSFLRVTEFSSCNNPVDPETEKACSEENRDKPAKIQRAKDAAAVCDGIAEQDFESTRYQAVMSAAKLGNSDAQACAIQGEFDLRKMPILSDDDRQQYEIAAMAYVDSFFENGDWRVVQALTPSSQAYSHGHKLKFSSMQGDEIAIYRLLALLRNGSTGSYADALDARLTSYEDARSRGLEGYDPQVLADARAWAKDQYERHFQNSPKLSEAPVVCGAI